MKKIYGVGKNDYEGKVTYTDENGKVRNIKSYATWINMIRRCYSDKLKEKLPTYDNCLVTNEWLLYSNFKKWFDKNYPIELSEEIKFELDKDLLYNENKVYSEYKCIFLPKRINTFLATKRSDNKTGYIGVSFNKKINKFNACIKDFDTKKNRHLGNFSTPEEANESYLIGRKYMVVLAKNYMRGLNIYSEETINKIK